MTLRIEVAEAIQPLLIWSIKLSFCLWILWRSSRYRELQYEMSPKLPMNIQLIQIHYNDEMKIFSKPPLRLTTEKYLRRIFVKLLRVIVVATSEVVARSWLVRAFSVASFSSSKHIFITTSISAVNSNDLNFSISSPVNASMWRFRRQTQMNIPLCCSVRSLIRCSETVPQNTQNLIRRQQWKRTFP